MKIAVPFLTAFLVLVTCLGCSDNDTETSSALSGIWYREVAYADEDQERVVEWSFGENGRLEISYAEFRRSTGQFLGYSVLYMGDFTYQNKVLYMQNTLGYSYAFDGEEFLPDAAYVPEKDLFFSRSAVGVADNSAAVSFIDFNRKMRLSYLECNDTQALASCIGEETLTRK